jgi:hypothetical protein
MDFEEGLNGYSSFLVSVHWQIAGMIFQTGSIETLTAAITKLLFHLSSKKPGSSLSQKLFAGAWNVFVGSSHEDDTANSISGGYDGLDDLRCGWSWLFIYYRDFATVSGTKTFGFSVIDNSFQLAADQFSNEFLTSRTGSSYYLVVVGDAGKHAGGLGEGLGVFFCKKAKLSDWRVFFQNDFAFTVGENFKRGTFFDSQGPADFFWDDHPAQFINAADDSGCFHLCTILPILHFPMLCSYYVEAAGKYTPARPVFAKQGRL